MHRSQNQVDWVAGLRTEFSMHVDVATAVQQPKQLISMKSSTVRVWDKWTLMEDLASMWRYLADCHHHPTLTQWYTCLCFHRPHSNPARPSCHQEAWRSPHSMWLCESCWEEGMLCYNHYTAQHHDLPPSSNQGTWLAVKTCWYCHKSKGSAH